MTRTRLHNLFRLLSLFVALELVAAPALPARAALFSGGIKIPSASSIISDIEKRYNIDPASVRSQGQTSNVADQKKLSPEVSLFFSPTDPTVGKKITALAVPMYFENPTEDLFYTWYLKHEGCDLKDGPLSSDEKKRCDLDGDDKITVEDWKIEATRLLINNDFDATAAAARGDYDNDDDNDGYDARNRFGGSNKVGVAPHCYYHDNKSGNNYEFSTSGDITFNGCTQGTAVCMEGQGEINPDTLDANATGGSGGGSPTGGDASVTGDVFSVDDTGNDYITGYPTCSESGDVSCLVGTPCCVSNPATATSCGEELTTCEGGDNTNKDAYCKHLFPNAPGAVTGNGTFGGGEEEFWGTDPHDPDTAQTGNKDEANATGLGRSSFSWNYAQGDLVGLAVEGISLIPTKYSDASNMVMWAFSKNNCPISLAKGQGALIRNVKGYDVTIPTVDIDLNKCLERNLVDPSLGGQASNLDVDVEATPDNPQNDTSDNDDGDVLEVNATISNGAKNLTDTYFSWRVEYSSDELFRTPLDITQAIQRSSADLLSPVKGNGIDKVTLKLNLKPSQIGIPDTNGGYLRFRVEAAENFNSGGATRKGKGSIIVKFSSLEDRLQAYKVDVRGGTDAPAHVVLSSDPNAEICSGFSSPTDTDAVRALKKLETKVCPVLTNEIIGISLNNTHQAYSNFSWTINGKPLVCNTTVSPSCFEDHQDNTNFFPVVGDPGEIITIALTANKVDTSNQATAKSVVLSRDFRIVSPEVQIVPGNNSVVAPTLGYYIDADNNAFPDYGEKSLDLLGSGPIDVTLNANFTPTFLENISQPAVERSWSVDGQQVGDGGSNSVSFTTNKPDGSLYNVNLAVAYRPRPTIRKALSDIWGISVLDTGEQYFGATTQLENQITEEGTLATTGPRHYLALLSSYLPASVLFSLRIFLSIALILFVSSLLFSLTPQTRSRSDV